MRLKTLLSLFALSLLFPTLAQAHVGHDHAFGFAQGFTHPVSGFDHILAMIAVGLWAWQLSGRAVWAVPMTFVGVMAWGGVMGMFGVTLPGVEQGILASVFLLGLCVMLAVRVPLAVSAALVAVFAMFHGYAHGAEMPQSASGYTYALGFGLATASLHGVGLLTAFSLQQLLSSVQVRWAGAGIVFGGVMLCFA
jgi:urease accessory protein